MTARAARAIAVVLGVAVLAMARPAAAQEPDGAAQELAERYAPLIQRNVPDDECGSDGEGFRPVAVEVLLGRDDVVLRGGDDAVIVTGPTAVDLAAAGADAYLDLPGDPLHPGCDYQRWFDDVARNVPTTVYAHVVVQADDPDTLALQYWMYWPYNDWNNKHESDWEMIQLVFPATTAAEALAVAPSEIGISQHEGAQRADWDDGSVQREGDRPVLFPSMGSHANYYESAVHLGHGADDGFGCDDTRGVDAVLDPAVVLVPTVPAEDDDDLAWLRFVGRWGERERGPNNGPTGPNTKPRWTEPSTWVEEEWRSGTAIVPAASRVAPDTTGFFCSAVARGSEVYLAFLQHPWHVVAGFIAVGAAIVGLSRRTRWSPVLLHPIDQERAAGQMLRTARRVRRAHRRLFTGIGLVFIPLGAFAAVAQEVVLSSTEIGDLVAVASDDALFGGLVALAFGVVASVAAAIIVLAATCAALRELEAEREPTLVGCYSTTGRHGVALLRATSRIAVVTILLAVTVVGIPLAVIYLVRTSLVVPAVVLEDREPVAAMRRSQRLVRGHGLRVLLLAGVVGVITALTGPVLGVVVLLLWSPALGVVNLVSSIVYAIVVPYACIVAGLLFLDLRQRAAAAAQPPTGDEPETVQVR